MFPWFDSKCPNKADTIFNAVTRLENYYFSTRKPILDLCRAFYTEPEVKAESFTALFTEGEAPSGMNNVPIIRALADTLLNRFAKNKPVPEILPVKGNWAARRKAKESTLWLKGIYKQNNVYTKVLPTMVLDALLTGVGATRIRWDDTAGIVYEQAHRENLYVHAREEYHRAVKTLYYTIGQSRYDVQSRYGSNAADQAAAYTRHIIDNEDELELEAVRITESWRLPCKKNDHGEWVGGKHIISTSNKILLEEEFKDPEFPWLFWNFRVDPTKFFGMGIAESALAGHLTTNEVCKIIDDAVDAMTPKILMDENEVISNKTNRIGAFWKVKNDPRVWAPPPVHHEVLAREQALISRTFRSEGVSEQDAMMMRPAGIESGIGQLVYHDIGSGRYAVPSMSLDELIGVDLARQTLRIADRACDAGHVQQLQTVGIDSHEIVQALAYDKARMDPSEYILMGSVVSSMPDTVTGKVELTLKLRDLGAVEDPAQIRRLINMPDLQGYSKFEDAPFELIDMIVDRHLEGEPPDTIPMVTHYMDIDYALTRFRGAYALATMHGADVDIINRLSTQIGLVTKLVNDRNAAAAALNQQQAAAAAPQAALPAPTGV